MYGLVLDRPERPSSETTSCPCVVLCGMVAVQTRPGARLEKSLKKKKGPTLLSDTPHPRFFPNQKEQMKGEEGTVFFFFFNTCDNRWLETPCCRRDLN